MAHYFVILLLPSSRQGKILRAASRLKNPARENPAGGLPPEKSGGEYSFRPYRY
jgi:hypothetical protein